MATRKKKTVKSESLQVNSACSAETTINILFDQPLKVKAPVLGSMPEASNNSRKKQRLKKSLEKVYQDGASELRLQKLRALIVQAKKDGYVPSLSMRFTFSVFRCSMSRPLKMKFCSTTRPCL